MKRIFVVLLFFSLGVGALFSQGFERIEIIDSITIESFDADATAWTVRGSRYVDDRLLEARLVEAWPNQLYGYAPEETLRAFGIRAGFERRGHNFIEIVPPNGVYPLRGIVREIELWVWNSGRDYYVNGELQDFRGVYHTIEFGDINHFGWRKLSARVPNSILQVEKPHEDINRLRLIKFVLWTDPAERVDDFQVYLDEVRVISDIFQRRVDGEQLADPAVVDSIWGVAQ